MFLFVSLAIFHNESIMKKLKGEGEYQHFLWKKKFFIPLFFYLSIMILLQSYFSFYILKIHNLTCLTECLPNLPGSPKLLLLFYSLLTRVHLRTYVYVRQ